MKKFYPVILLVFSLLLSASFSLRAEPRHQTAPEPQWIMTFDDEFDKGALDTTKWTASRGPMDIREKPLQY